MTKNTEGANMSARSGKSPEKTEPLKSGKSAKSAKFVGRTQSKSPAASPSKTHDETGKPKTGKIRKPSPRKSAAKIRSNSFFKPDEEIKSTPEFDDLSSQGLTSLSLKILQSKILIINTGSLIILKLKHNKTNHSPSKNFVIS